MDRLESPLSIPSLSRRPRFPLSPLQFLIRTMMPAIAVLALAAGAAPAIERNAYSMELLVNGVSLNELSARGNTYVEAVEGAEYSIRLSNLTGERVAVALSVDGLNTIDAKTTPARDARKWILAPWETVVLDGWQTSSDTARRFFFTSESDSYGGWLGKTKNLGIVTAAVFREKRPAVSNGAPKERYDRPSPAARQPQSAPSALGKAESDSSVREQRAGAPATALSDELAATGIGRELDHQVRRVEFDAEATPAAVLDLRYEYHAALVRLGVVPAPDCANDALARREHATGFEALDFAPDPFRQPSRR